MVVPPGYSVNDLITVTGWAKAVWDAFFDDYNNAPRQIKSLGDVIQFFKDQVETHQVLLTRAGKKYPESRINAIDSLLKACDGFLNDYSTISESGPSRDGITIAKRVFQTTRFAFDDTVVELRDSLEREMILLLVFSFGVQMSLQLDSRGDLSNGAPSPATSRASSDDTANITSAQNDALQRIITELKRVQYTFERIGSASTAAPEDQRRQPDYTPVYGKFQSLWKEFCVAFGIPEEEVPELAPKEVLQPGSSFRANLVIKTSSRSFRDSATTLPTQTKVVLSSSPDENHVAELDLRQCRYSQFRKVFELQHYEIRAGRHGRTITWTCRDSDLVLKHVVRPVESDFLSPRQAHPYTLHKAQERFNRRPQVDFTKLEDPHKFHVWQGEDKTELLVYRPVYTFASRKYRDYFLGHLRGKDLQRFEPENIQSAKDSCMAHKQVLYLWLDPDNIVSRHSFSFWTTSLERHQHIEFAACWFRDPIEEKSKYNQNTLRLEFFGHDQHRKSHRASLSFAPSSPVISVMSNTIRKLSKDFSRQSTELPTPPNSGQGPAAERTPSFSGHDRYENREPAPKEVIDEYGGWISIDFAKDKKAVAEFKKAFEGALHPPFDLPPPAVTEEAGPAGAPTLDPNMPESESPFLMEWQSTFPT